MPGVQSLDLGARISSSVARLLQSELDGALVSFARELYLMEDGEHARRVHG